MCVQNPSFLFPAIQRCTSGGEIPPSFVGIEQLLFSSLLLLLLLEIGLSQNASSSPSLYTNQPTVVFSSYPQERRGIVSYFMATLRQPHSLHCLLVTALCLPPSLIPCVFPLCSFWFSPPLSFPYSGALITATAREKKQKPNIRKGENGVGLVFFFCPSGFFPFLDPGIRQIGFVTLNRLFFLFFIFFWGGVPRSPFRAHWIKIEFWGGWRRRKKRVFSDPPLPDCS